MDLLPQDEDPPALFDGVYFRRTKGPFVPLVYFPAFTGFHRDNVGCDRKDKPLSPSDQRIIKTTSAGLTWNIFDLRVYFVDRQR